MQIQRKDLKNKQCHLKTLSVTKEEFSRNKELQTPRRHIGRIDPEYKQDR